MIKKIKFPCGCDVMHYTTPKIDELKIKLPFMSNVDEEFWEGASDKFYTKLEISVRETDQWGYEEIISKLIYEEGESTTLWIIVYDIHFSIYRFWIVQNRDEKDKELFTEFAKNLNLN